MEVIYDGSKGSITGLSANELEYLFQTVKGAHTGMAFCFGADKETKDNILRTVNPDLVEQEDEDLTEKDAEMYNFLFDLYNQMEHKIEWIRPINIQYNELMLQEAVKIEKPSDQYRLNHVHHSAIFKGVEKEQLKDIREALFKYVAGSPDARAVTHYYNAGRNILYGIRYKSGNISIYQTNNFKRYDYIKGEPNKVVKCIDSFYSKDNPEQVMINRVHPFIEVGDICTVLHEADVEGVHYYTFAEYTVKEAAELWYISEMFETINQ